MFYEVVLSDCYAILIRLLSHYQTLLL